MTFDPKQARERAEKWVCNRDGSVVTRETALGEDHMALDVLDLLGTNERLQRELNEALRQLRKSTGCDWTQVIEMRALPWVKRKTCETCKGLGEIPVDKWSASMDIEPTRCETCKGQGEIYFEATP